MEKHIISTDITKAIALLNQEELVAIPTETVYGLAGNIFSEKAIHAIFKTKKRPLFNPLIVHIASVSKLENLASYIPKKAKILAEKFWPGALTLVLPKKDNVPDLITAGKNTVAVRIPNHPVTLELLNQLDFPLAAPSANPFNRISPTKAAHVAKFFKDNLKLVLDGGPCSSGIESTIVGFEGEEPIIYRLGAISIEDIEAVVGTVKVLNNEENVPQAPGMLKKHYSPNTKLILSDTIEATILKNTEKKVGILSFTKSFKTKKHHYEIVLSPSGNLAEATEKLYNAMHELDHQNLDIIIAERMPNYGLGKSMNDRLERASK
jgi:L-threonylcarbamoyladenylate synthase